MYVVPVDLMEKIPAEYRHSEKIRAFAVKHGLKVGARGRFSREVLEAYAGQFVSTFAPDVDPDEVPF